MSSRTRHGSIHLAAVLILAATACGGSGDPAGEESEGTVPTDQPMASTPAPPATDAMPVVTQETAPSSSATSETIPAVVVEEFPYLQTESGRTLHLDLYRPSAGGAGMPLVVLFHGNPIFGRTKESVRTLARMIAERGAVVVAPTWGNMMAMDMGQIASALVAWNLEHGPCAVWTAVDLAASIGAETGRVTLVGEATGVLPAQAMTFGPPATDVPGCTAPAADVSISRAILFDTDWLLVPDIWDGVLSEDPGFLAASAYWDEIGDPGATAVRMLFGETTAPDTVRSLDGQTYLESDWVRLRDPDGRFAGDFEALGLVDDGSISFSDVALVVTGYLIASGWDATTTVVPGAGHSLTTDESRSFVADLVFGDP